MNLIAKIILENRREGIPEDLIKREENVAEYFKLRPRKIVVITGFRRVGKSYLCFQSMEKLDMDKVAYINFEDERLEGIRDIPQLLTSAIYEIKPEYLFLDEIQKVRKWSLWLRRFYDREKNRIQIVVTGSSSKLSSREIPTELRGRNLVLHLFPLSFGDFLSFKGKKIDIEAIEFSERERGNALALLKEYVQYGSMPEIINYSPRKKAETLREYLSLVVARDIIERYKIRKPESVNALIKLLLNSQRITYSKLLNSMKSIGFSIGKETILSYIEKIKSSYFFFEIPSIKPTVKELLRGERKVIIIDNGFINFFSLRFSESIGRLMENLVGVRLIERSMNNPFFDVFFWKDHQQREVDFVLKEGSEVKQLIQVCYDPSDLETKDRELKALVKASNQLNCKNLLVITWDHEAKEEFKGKKIRLMPLWKWLLVKNRT
ncbi:MAG TPA: ATP-binding protein [Candidatus Aenigmarchaeota archaeon]|nr:ATP-binding protein [Candidatus Aenigmarchaeota archaeon]